MPDKRKHRGKHPDDDTLFRDSQLPALRAAVGEYSWLLTHGYAEASALKLVGDRHGLAARQRMAVMRCSCSDESVRHRAADMMPAGQCHNIPLGIDGYNLLITVESALSGGLVLIGRDGCYRDLGGVHGSYRKVEETVPALEAILDHLRPLDFPRIDWYLDRPVSNSGRLKVILAELLEARATAGDDQAARWNIEIVDSPDAILIGYEGVVATSDSAILDRRSGWINLAADIVNAQVPGAWKIELRPETALRAHF